MSDVVAIDTLDLDTLNDGPFFLAASHTLTTAVAALGNLTVVWKTCFLQTFEIILNGNRPALSEIRTLRLGAKEEPDHILAV